MWRCTVRRKRRTGPDIVEESVKASRKSQPSFLSSSLMLGMGFASQDTTEEDMVFYVLYEFKVRRHAGSRKSDTAKLPKRTNLRKVD